MFILFAKRYKDVHLLYCLLVSSACKCAFIYLAFVFVSVYSRFLNASAGRFFPLWSWFERDKADSRLMTISLWNWIFCKQADYTLLLEKVTFIFQKMIFECCRLFKRRRADGTAGNTHVRFIWKRAEWDTDLTISSNNHIFLKSSLCVRFPLAILWTPAAREELTSIKKFNNVLTLNVVYRWFCTFRKMS